MGIATSARTTVYAAYARGGWPRLRDTVLSAAGRSRAVVLYYHRIGERDVISKPLDAFRRDLAFLKRRFEVITLAELCRRIEGGEPFRRPAAVITFDDGYRDNYGAAMPALVEAGLPATFFVSTGFIGTDRPFPHDVELHERGLAARPAEGWPKMSWDELRAMQDAGFEIGGHTVSHANVGRLDPEAARWELTESSAALTRQLGQRPRPFSFPFGKPGDIPPDAATLVRAAGYYAACSAYGGTNGPEGSHWNVLRVDVGNGLMPEAVVRARMLGLDPDYRRHLRAGWAPPLADARARRAA